MKDFQKKVTSIIWEMIERNTPSSTPRKIDFTRIYHHLSDKDEDIIAKAIMKEYYLVGSLHHLPVPIEDFMFVISNIPMW